MYLSTFWRKLKHFSSSLGATTSFFKRFGPLNIEFPLIAILDAASPILYFQFLYIIYYYHLAICSLVFLVVVLTSVSTCILFLPFYLPSFDVNGQTSLIFELLCDLLCSYVLLMVETFTWIKVSQRENKGSDSETSEQTYHPRPVRIQEIII